MRTVSNSPKRVRAREYERKWVAKHPDRNKARAARHKAKIGLAASRRRSNLLYYALKLDILQAYGGCKCVCCGEDDVRFLSFDHVFNDGAAERRKYKGKGNLSLWHDLRRRGFPDKHRYQVLCYNCNMGRAANGGVCPHEG